MRRVFFLSPARTTGKRARALFSSKTSSLLGQRLQRGEAAPIGEIFSFLSGLYFRGKMAYVKRFAGDGNAFVITSNQGLVPVGQPILLEDLRSFSEVEIHAKSESYRRALEIDLARWAKEPEVRFVFLGSIASSKYLPLLMEFLGGRLEVPAAFGGMGDMSRGSLMLRSAAKGRELPYVTVTSPFPAAPRRPNLLKKQSILMPSPAHRKTT